MAATTVIGAAKTVGNMYFCWTLDSLNELAYAVSLDFVNRPQLYQSVPIADTLVQFRMHYGTDPNFPNAQQRQAMQIPIFGRSDAQRPDATSSSLAFYAARKKLLDAAASYAERAVDTGVQMLRERIRSAIVPLKSNLHSAYGSSLEASEKQVRSLFNHAVDILKDAQISKVFGVNAPDTKWPQDSDDPNGAKLVGSISATLTNLKTLSADVSLTQDKFILLRRVAHEGRAALIDVYDSDKATADLDQLITSAYTWGTSLRDFQP